MASAVDVVETGQRLDGRSLLEELRRPRDAQYVLIHAHGVRVGEAALSAMLDAARAPMAATVSPLPVPVADASEVAVVAGDTNLLTAYRVWVFEIDGTRAARATDENALPEWAERFEPSKIDKVASLIPPR